MAGRDREATLYLPPTRRPAPGWVVLHGLTVPGRHHVKLVRFARSLAGSGAVVLVPDVPAWREVLLDVTAARETLADAVLHLAARPEVKPGGVGAVGFSFGATQVLMAAADPALRGALKAVLAFGGYCDLGRILRCMFTGEHEWAGRSYWVDPDPYGRWAVVGNYLTLVPGYGHLGAVQQAALELVQESGRMREWAWEPVYDPIKDKYRARLGTDEERRVWDVVAAPSHTPLPDLEMSRALADAFAAAALEKDPGLDPRPRLGGLHGRILLTHGREDRLIPFTESLRLLAHMPGQARASATITG
ncbi:MAG TPA: hypothetical protein VFX98_04840, partial [Longimicrobiaceae bacterium]|nr:hypothetical protein [Longimicrobiaceae bacterium]